MDLTDRQARYPLSVQRGPEDRRAQHRPSDLVDQPHRLGLSDPQVLRGLAARQGRYRLSDRPLQQVLVRPA
ncbi:MAG TPA: hypothetical protein VKA18_11030, partial [Alphaproteobacteria bacterium]|nr:hypothetical protein [Alphaproteobacteria bacterium]